MHLKKTVFVFIISACFACVGYMAGQTETRQALNKMPSPAFAASVDSNGNQIFVSVSRKLMPSVVNIFTTSTIQSPWGRRAAPDDLWRRFFEDFFGEFDEGPSDPGIPPGPFSEKPQKAMSLGSGFVIEKFNGGGLVLTNNHVVEGADEIRIKFTEEIGEKESEAELIGRDPELDIALLKVKTKRNLQAVILGNSDELEVGEWVGAMGNPFGHGHTFTHGIVSAKERSLPGSFARYLQVDAPINPGNSGGPLANLNGEVVGINNAIDARGPGIGFAIPINAVKAVLPQLKEKGIVDRGYIGVSVDELRPELAGQLKLDLSLRAPIVTNVIPGHPAAKAGMKVYDVITEVNGKMIHSAQELVGAITGIPIGDKARIKILRSGKEKSLSVEVARRPDFQEEQARLRGGLKRKYRGAHLNLGMQIENINPGIARELNLPDRYKGVVVSRIDPTGPAFEAGLRRGDVILEVDRKKIRSEKDFFSVVKTKKTYLIRVRKRDESGREAFVVVALRLDRSADAQEDEE